MRSLRCLRRLRCGVLVGRRLLLGDGLACPDGSTRSAGGGLGAGCPGGCRGGGVWWADCCAAAVDWGHGRPACFGAGCCVGGLAYYYLLRCCVRFGGAGAVSFSAVWV